MRNPTYLSVVSSISTSGFSAPSFTMVAMCSGLPPEVRFANAHTASFLVSNDSLGRVGVRQ